MPVTFDRSGPQSIARQRHVECSETPGSEVTRATAEES